MPAFDFVAVDQKGVEKRGVLEVANRVQALERIREMAKFPARKTRSYFRMQNGVKERVGFNVFEPIRMKGALSKQVYWPACFRFDEGEALIIETELPERRPYWNIQLNDPYIIALEYVYRLSLAV